VGLTGEKTLAGSIRKAARAASGGGMSFSPPSLAVKARELLDR